MPRLIYDDLARDPKKASLTQPFLRTAPLLIGSPADLRKARLGPHILKLGVPLADDALPFRLSKDDVIRAVGAHLHMLGVLCGGDFYDQWALIPGSLVQFDAAGIMFLDEDRSTNLGVPIIITDPSLQLPYRTSIGNSSYSPAFKLALAVVGAQLFLCDRVLTGLFLHGGVSAARNTAFERLSPLLVPLRTLLRNGGDAETEHKREQLRSSEGEIGTDDYVYRSLLRRGSELVRDVYGRDGTGKGQLGKRWLTTGSRLAERRQGKADDIPTIDHMLDGLRSAIVMAQHVRARQQAERAVDPGHDGEEQNERRSLVLDFRAAKALVGASPLGDAGPDLFALTRLAFAWDVDPAAFYARLEDWRFHFAAARHLGRVERSAGAPVKLDAPTHWGLKALDRDIFDGALDHQTRAARAWLRGLMPKHSPLWEETPDRLLPLAGDEVSFSFRSRRRRNSEKGQS